MAVRGVLVGVELNEKSSLFPAFQQVCREIIVTVLDVYIRGQTGSGQNLFIFVGKSVANWNKN